eukprot:Nitzschia sp. Nitz4//scaffold66_size103028//32655//37048//NITZ4_004495-RA/size103028-processed-gene-0.116-mRNA-1//-1//CDS//3329556341//3559//frame0
MTSKLLTLVVGLVGLTFQAEAAKENNLRHLGVGYTPSDELVVPVVDCTPEAPCGKCMGDCDTDSDCADGLVCYQKLGKAQSEAEATVPGCSGLDWSRTDWCVDPSDLEPSKAKPTIFDTDYGPFIDDVFALGLLVNSDDLLDLKAVVTTSENPELSAKCVAKHLDISLRGDIPVAVGAEFPDYSVRGGVCGIPGYLGFALEPECSDVDLPLESNGVEFLANMIMESGRDDWVYIAVGAQSTLMALIEDYPEVVEKIETLIIMGGNWCADFDPYPDVTAPTDETNIACDIPAANYVLDAGNAMFRNFYYIPVVVADVIGGEDYSRFVESAQSGDSPSATATLDFYQAWSDNAREDPDLLIYAEAWLYDPVTESTPQFDACAVMMALELLGDCEPRISLYEFEGLHFLETGDDGLAPFPEQPRSAFSLWAGEFDGELPDQCPSLTPWTFETEDTPETEYPVMVGLGYYSAEAKASFFADMATRMAGEIPACWNKILEVVDKNLISSAASEERGKRGSIMHPPGSETKVKVLVCSANMGNQQPDQDSINAWIPRDGETSVVCDHPRYPLPSTIHGLSDSVASILEVPRNGKNSTSTSSALEKFDIIVFGMQEATFKVQDYDENNFPKPLLPHAQKAQKAVNELTISKDHTEKAKKQQLAKRDSKVVPPVSSPSSLRKSSTKDKGVIYGSFVSLLEEPEFDDTFVLHDLFQKHLPSYDQAISYQQGQMRLMLFYNPDNISLEVLSIKVQNTGMGGLANKGGIVTEVRINGSTRVAFLTAHLEAHEGPEKYKARCASMNEILRSTASDIPQCRCDVALASHFTFVMGDLNFRTKLDGYEPGSSEHIAATRELTEKLDWETIYKNDELSHAIQKNHCLSGFQTPLCHFPPTFKVERQAGYAYNEKRSPSYTDRILYAAGHRLRSKIKVLAYEPIDDFTSSDHKPIRGAFEVTLNPSLKMRPTLPTRRSILGQSFKDGAPNRRNSNVIKETRKFLHLYISNIRVQVDKETYKNSDLMAPCPFVCFVSTPAHAIKYKMSPWTKLSQALRRTTTGYNLKNASGTKAWPRTKPIMNTYDANWGEEEVHFKVRTHHHDGTPLDLTGAMIHVTVFDGKSSSKLTGVFSLNLASLIEQSRGLRTLEAVRPPRRIRNLFSSMRSDGRRLSLSFRQSDRTDHPGGSESAYGHDSAADISRKWDESKLVDKEDGVVCQGPSGALKRAASIISVGGHLETLDIQSTKLEEPLRKYGVEVGKVHLTIDCWWLNDDGK